MTKRRRPDDPSPAPTPEDLRRIQDLAGVDEDEARRLLLQDTGPFGEDGPDPPLPDTPLGWALAPWEHLLAALQALTDAGAGWEEVDRVAGRLLKDRERLREWGVDEPAARLEEVAASVAARAELLRKAETLIVAEGLMWSRERKRVEIPPGPEGGRPRQLLREMVRRLCDPLAGPAPDDPFRSRKVWPLGFAPTAPSEEVRVQIADALAPYFGVDLVDTGKGSPLYSAVEAVLGSKA